VQAVEAVARAEVDVCALSFQQLHCGQLLPKDRVVHGCKPPCVSLVDPLPFALPVEGVGLGGCALVVEGEDELDDVGVAAVGGSVEEGAARAVDQLVDICEVLLDELEGALVSIAKFDCFEHPP
jgi:hypothetical protein